MTNLKMWIREQRGGLIVGGVLGAALGGVLVAVAAHFAGMGA